MGTSGAFVCDCTCSLRALSPRHEPSSSSLHVLFSVCCSVYLPAYLSTYLSFVPSSPNIISPSISLDTTLSVCVCEFGIR